MENKTQSTVKYIIGAISVIILIGIVIGSYIYREQPKELINISETGAFVLLADDNGNIIVKKPTEKYDNTKANLVWYSDPLCPDCHRAFNSSKEYISEKLTNSKLEIEYHTLDILSKYNEYFSTKVSAYIMAIANEYPRYTYKFLTTINDDEFVKTYMEKMNTKQDKEFIDYIIENVGIEKCNLENIRNHLAYYTNIVKKASKNFKDNEQLLEKAPDKDRGLFVPFIYDPTTKEHKALLGEDEDAVEHILKPIQKLVGCKENEKCRD